MVGKKTASAFRYSSYADGSVVGWPPERRISAAWSAGLGDAGDADRNLVLEVEDIGQRSVEPFGREARRASFLVLTD